MSVINIELSETTMKQIIREYLELTLGDVILNEKDIKIEVKSKQNYKSEWEVASFRATVNKTF